ncbi:MAG TPA: glycosyltransferase family 2 protein, partial [Bacteroidales bacterium]|nr:glycosyltransferase family 2 protein [Bacteroidales bacterium]
SDYYTQDFYKFIGQDSLQSAREIVPLVLDIIPCERVVDVGCGNGAWLKVFQENGIKEILGIDGEYVNEEILLIPKQNFMPWDLKQVLQFNKKFDLVMSLEVAEHLPAECAATFVESLTNLGSVILFSGAIPYQGGENHINEQWPAYWINLFKTKNYVAVDCIRRKVWNNKSVAYWYSQNLFIFVEKSYLETNHKLKKELESANNTFSPIVHPGTYIDAKIKLLKLQEALDQKTDIQKISFKWILKQIPKLIKRNFKRSIKLVLNNADALLNSFMDLIIRPTILSYSIKHLYGSKKISYELDELIVTCLVRNGELNIKSFIEHYFALGVKHIVFLNNGSTDDTVKIASSYDNVTILQTKCPYRKYETLMKKYLVNRFSRNRWNLFADIDELFDYPFSHALDLKSFLNYLNKNSYTAVVAQMLDLFSNQSLGNLRSTKYNDLKSVYIYYDLSDIHKDDYRYGELSNKQVKMHYGGIRKTLFGTNNGLTKVPLILVDKNTKLFVDYHHVKKSFIADLTCVLFHYPFTSRFCEKVTEAVKTDRYALSAGHEYKKYWEGLQEDPDINIKSKSKAACKLEELTDLIENGFLVVSPQYMQWVKRVLIKRV